MKNPTVLLTQKLSLVNYIAPVTEVDIVSQVIDGIRMAFFISSDRAGFTYLRPVNDAEELARFGQRR